MKDILLRFARYRTARRLIPWMFTHLNHLIPINRLHETETLVAFRHPKPIYPLHILIVPKQSIADLSSLQENDLPFLQDLFCCIAVLVKNFNLDEHGYRLIANGGPYQDVPQLHFHLISEYAPTNIEKPPQPP